MGHKRSKQRFQRPSASNVSSSTGVELRSSHIHTVPPTPTHVFVPVLVPIVLTATSPPNAWNADPVLLAGMANISLPELAAAVSNAGGMGVIGGAFITPDTLRAHLKELKSLLRDPSLPFGVDLLLPQVGGSARATNKDYTRGTLGELVDIMIEEGVSLFVCAVRLTVPSAPTQRSIG